MGRQDFAADDRHAERRRNAGPDDVDMRHADDGFARSVLLLRPAMAGNSNSAIVITSDRAASDASAASRMASMAYGQDWTGRAADYVARLGSEHPSFERVLTLRAHDDEIGVPLGGEFQNRMAGSASGRGGLDRTELRRMHRDQRAQLRERVRFDRRMQLVEIRTGHDRRDAQLGWNLDDMEQRQLCVRLLGERDGPRQSGEPAFREVHRADDVLERHS